MKKQVKNKLIFAGIILLILLFLILPLKKHPVTSEEIAKCIGENSILYTQIGCHACEVQEDMFGENKKFLKKIDCFYEPQKCAEITGTPTWNIKGKEYVGVQSIEKLKELTNC